MPIPKNEIKNLSPIKERPSKTFEKRVEKFVAKYFDQRFFSQSLKIGPNKFHEFDLVSENKMIIIECKCPTWRMGKSRPEGKICEAIKDLFFLTRIQAQKKILVIRSNISNRDKDIVDLIANSCESLTDETEIWRYVERKTPVKDEIEVVCSAGKSWYKEMYEIDS